MIIKPLKFTKPTAQQRLNYAVSKYTHWCAVGVGGYWEIARDKATRREPESFSLTGPDPLFNLDFPTRAEAEAYANREHVKAIKKMVTP